MGKLVIKGAYYKSGDTILMPHYTGEYGMVDCARYYTEEEMKITYNEQFIQDNKNDYVDVDNVRYYYAEYSPFNVDDDWELLSDLSDLRHTEDSFNF